MTGRTSTPSPERLLVVATAPCSPAATDAIVAAATRADEVVVVCPAPASALNYWMNDRRSRGRAEELLATTLDALRARGLAAHGEVGDDDPLQALDDAVVVHRPSAALLLTPIAGSAGWLERGVVAAARGRFPFPVEHVAVDEAGAVVDDHAALEPVERRNPGRDAAVVAVLAFLAALGSAFWFVGPAVGAVPEWALVCWAVFFDVVPKAAFGYALWRLYLGRRFGDRLAAPVGALAVAGTVDSGWAAWLPLELLDALAAAGGGAALRRRFRDRLRRGPDAISAERWERFRLVAPSRIDVPATADGLDETTCYALLEELGLVGGAPPRPRTPEPVELVLTLDHDDLRELEGLRAARDVGGAGAPLPADMPSLDLVFGAGTGRNEPCPCGSGKKFKRCHGG